MQQIKEKVAVEHNCKNWSSIRRNKDYFVGIHLYRYVFYKLFQTFGVAEIQIYIHAHKQICGWCCNVMSN